MAKELQFRFGQNILHNWDFRNAVNKREGSEYINVSSTTNIYMIDRWNLNPYCKAIIETDGLRIINNSPDTIRGFSQRIEHPELYYGKIYTFSIMDDTGTIYSNSFDIPPLNTLEGYADIPILNEAEFIASLHYNIPANNAISMVIVLVPGASKKFKSVKLETGIISTLANDPPMDYGRELAVCQRYQLKLGTPSQLYRCAWVGGNSIVFIIPTPITMRISPAIVGLPNAEWYVYSTAGVVQPGFTFTATALENGIRIDAAKASHGLTDASLSVLNMLFDANL